MFWLPCVVGERLTSWTERKRNSIRPLGQPDLLDRVRFENCSCPSQAIQGDRAVTDSLVVAVPHERADGTCRAVMQISILGSTFILFGHSPASCVPLWSSYTALAAP